MLKSEDSQWLRQSCARYEEMCRGEMCAATDLIKEVEIEICYAEHKNNTRKVIEKKRLRWEMVHQQAYYHRGVISGIILSDAVRWLEEYCDTPWELVTLTRNRVRSYDFFEDVCTSNQFEFEHDPSVSVMSPDHWIATEIREIMDGFSSWMKSELLTSNN